MDDRRSGSGGDDAPHKRARVSVDAGSGDVAPAAPLTQPTSVDNADATRALAELQLNPDSPPHAHVDVPDAAVPGTSAAVVPMEQSTALESAAAGDAAAGASGPGALPPSVANLAAQLQHLTPAPPDVNQAPTPPLMQLMIESHASSGSKRTCVVRLPANATVRDLFAALRDAEGLPSTSAAVQRLWGGVSGTLSINDEDRPLADVGIRDEHQRTLRHFLAPLGASGIPLLHPFLSADERLPRTKERVTELLKAVILSSRKAGIGGAYPKDMMAISLLAACRNGDFVAAYALAMYGAPPTTDVKTGLAAPAFLLHQAARGQEGSFNPAKEVLAAIDAVAAGQRAIAHDPSDLDAAVRLGLRFALHVLEAAGEWEELELGGDEGVPRAKAYAKRLVTMCAQRSEWRGLVGRLLAGGHGDGLHSDVVAYACVALGASQLSDEARARARRNLASRGARGTLAVLALATVPTARGVLAYPAVRGLLEAGDLDFEHASVGAALLEAIATAAAGLDTEHVGQTLGRRTTPLAALVAALLKRGAPAVTAHVATLPALGGAPLLPEAVLAQLVAHGYGQKRGLGPELGSPMQAAGVVEALVQHPPTLALAGGALHVVACAGLELVVAELARLVATAVRAAGDEGEDEEAPPPGGAEVRAGEQELEALERALPLLSFPSATDQDEDRRAIAADLAMRVAAAVADALRVLEPSLRSARLLSCPAILSTRPVEFVWRAMATAAQLARTVGCDAAVAADLRPFRRLLSSCGHALLAARAFRGSRLARAVALVPGCVAAQLRHELIVAEHFSGSGAADEEEEDEEGGAGVPPLQLVVSRDTILDNSIAGLGPMLLPMALSASAEHHFRSSVAKMQVMFEGEVAHGPGVLREYMRLCAERLLDPSVALFRRHSDARGVYFPSPDSRIQPNHLSIFRLCGWLMGAAIATGAVFPVYFPDCLYAYLLERPLELEDLASVEPTIARGLRENVLQRDVGGLHMCFAVDEVFFGAHRSVELRPGGEAEAVTEENKGEYVHLAVEYYLVGRVRAELAAMREGLRRVLPEAAAAALTPAELRLLVEGRPEIDVEDWRRNARYGNGLTAASQEAVWFWEYVTALGPAARSRLLAFVTGSPRPPPGGFAHLVASSGRQELFKLVGDDRGAAGRLPSAHTCFNELVLPRYESASELAARFEEATRADCGFGFA